MNASVGSAPTSAAAVANEFLELGWQEKGMPPVDQMKLQKLIFYAHAWYLAYTGTPLFDEDFEAWPWGPVVRDVYFQTREFGRLPVTTFITKLAPSPGKGSLLFDFVTPRIEEPNLKTYLKSIWESHKGFSGTQLSNATHLVGEPWTVIKNQYGNLDSKPTIPNDLIAAIFKQKAENATTSTSAS